MLQDGSPELDSNDDSKEFQRWDVSSHRDNRIWESERDAFVKASRSPRTMQALVLKRKLAKDHLSGFITETPLKRGRKVFHHNKSCRIARVMGWCFVCEGKLHKALNKHDKKIRLAWTKAVTKESLPSRDCNSLIVKHSRDSHNCNSSDKSRSRESGTRKVKSSVLTRMPKQTISTAGGESFSGDEAKPNESKRVCSESRIRQSGNFGSIKIV